jgi:NADH:ubiquinone oxidoreductase subunit E
VNEFDYSEQAASLAAFLGSEPCGRSCLEICQGSACREVGNEELLAALERLSGVRRDCTAADGSLTLKAGICQGRCAVGPNVRLNGLGFNVGGPGEAEELLRRALEHEIHGQ